jgi:hypothetical protein
MAGGVVQVAAQLLLVEVIILQPVHLNVQPNVNDILLKLSSTSVKHIEGIVPSVGVIVIKGPDRQHVGCLSAAAKRISIS